MKDKSRVVVATISGAALVAIGWFGNQTFGPRPVAREAKASEPVAVTAVVAERAVFNPATEYVGHVEPAQATDILPQIDGYVKKVCFTEGSFVKSGDLLFEIDAEQYEASRNLRHSEVRSAEANVVVAMAELDRAQRYFKRLSSADDRGVTATEIETAEATLATAKAALNAANAAVEQAKASAAIADFNLKHTKIYSPISGRIGKALRHVGDYVSPSKSALARVVQLDPIRVVFPITDRDYDAWQQAAERGGAALKDSRRLRLRLANGEEYGKVGFIEFGDNEMNLDTGTLVMHVRFANPDARLVPNAFVRVISDEANPPQEVQLPSAAVELTDEGRRVWILGDDGRVKACKVEIGGSAGGRTVIRSGLEDRTRVVGLGGFKLNDGDVVKVVE